MPTVRMVEHLLAAFAVCGIDNALVDASGPELPVMDGSALPFVHLIECAGTVAQAEPVAELKVLRTVIVREGGAEARLEPAPCLQLEVRHRAAAATAPFALRFSPETGRRELAGAREPAACGAGDRRFADEHLRHVALDALGDLALIPARLQARYVGAGAGPGLRQRLLRRLLAEPDAWRLEGPAPPAPFLASLGAEPPGAAAPAPGRSSRAWAAAGPGGPRPAPVPGAAPAPPGPS
jgi:UDP-3-O-[3-hydroxymyristoyl] N-acetylglucosamine deacetylase